MIRIGAFVREELLESLQAAVAPFGASIEWWGAGPGEIPAQNPAVAGVIVELTEELWGSTVLFSHALADLPVAGLVVSEESHAVAADLGVIVLISQQDQLEAWCQSLSPSAARDSAGLTGPSTGSVVAVWGPPGSPGTTSMAVTLAGLLSLSNQRVLVVDADTVGASVGLALKLPQSTPGIIAASRMARVETITAEALLACTVEYVGHRARFRVVTGLLAPDKYADIDLTSLRRAMSVLRDDGHTLVVDVAGPLDQYPHDVIGGPVHNGVQRAVLEMADKIVVVTTPTATHTSRLLRSWPVLTALAPETQTIVVCNRVSKNHSSQLEEVKYALWSLGGVEEVLSIPMDSTSMTRAETEGVTVVDLPQKSQITEALRPVVRALGFEQLSRALQERPRDRKKPDLQKLWKMPARKGLL